MSARGLQRESVDWISSLRPLPQSSRAAFPYAPPEKNLANPGGKAAAPVVDQKSREEANEHRSVQQPFDRENHMKLKPVALTLCAATLALSAVSGNAARFGDENDVSWLPMTGKQHEFVAKQFQGGNFCLSATRYGDENNGAWLMKSTPCKDRESMVRVRAGWEQGAGAIVRIRRGNDVSWLPTARKQKAIIQ